MQDARFADYLFARHPRQTLGGWARALGHLRFCRALGGHANDGDSFRAAVCFQGEAGLLGVCRRLALGLDPLAPDTPRPLAGRPYSGEEFARFPRPIAFLPHYEQPGRVRVLGVPAFVWVGRDVVELELSGAGGDPYVVTEADFQNAKRLDHELGGLGLEFRDPPVNTPHCVCPDFWPELFQR